MTINLKNKREAHNLPPPAKAIELRSMTGSETRSHTNILRGFAGALALGALGFDGLFVSRLDPANVHLDLPGLGFGLFWQIDLQHAFVVARRNVFGIHGAWQGEGAGKAAVLALHAAIVLFFFFFFDLALAVHRQSVVFHADVDVFL